MNPRTILHLNTERGWRGGEVQTLLLAMGLRDRGHRCHLAVPPASPLERAATREGIPVLPLKARGELDLLGVLQLAGHLRSLRPDLVHYHTSHAVTLGTLASFIAGRRATVASRRVSFPLARNPLARVKYTWRVDRILAVSEGIRETLEAAGVPRGRTAVIHSAVDLRRFSPPSDRSAVRRELGCAPGEFLVGAVGHLAAHKGHAFLVEAAARLATADPKFRFLLVGSGEEEVALRRRIEDAGLRERFHLTGFRDDVAAILPALDLLVFPSLSGEGSPAVLKEAMACGVALVASDISGVREVIRAGVEGVLVPPGDAPSLADAIQLFAGNAAMRLEFVARGLQRARAFGPERMVDSTELVYRELLAESIP